MRHGTEVAQHRPARVVEAHGVRPAAGEPRRHIPGSASKLDSVETVELRQEMQFILGNVPPSPT
jgi:hypothetical protein